MARDGGSKSGSVNFDAIGVVARWRVCLVQREPFLGLLDAIVVKLVIHLSRTQRLQQIAAHSFRKLAGVNGDVGNR